jgi:exonuclease III
MDKKSTYKLISYNCKSVKRSVECIRQLCRTRDIIALQETWLLPGDVPFLSEIDVEFGCTGMSAVDTGAGMLRGRPYGGVALLWRKSVFTDVSVVQCDNPRVCAIKVNVGQRSFLVFSVYMPTDKDVNLTEFTDCLSLVSAIINNNSIESGDFNSHPRERFYFELDNFCVESQWSCADIELLGFDSGTCTFLSEANGSKRWLDHCVVTQSARETIISVQVVEDVLWSDHFPLQIEILLNEIKPKFYKKDMTHNKVRWGDRKPDQCDMYNNLCSKNLKLIDFPIEMTKCCNYVCNNLDHRLVIDNMYDRIVHILSRAASDSHSSSVPRFHRPVVGWNRLVSDAHKVARDKFQLWVLYGRPAKGRVWNDMQTSRKIFKSRLRWCQNHKDQIKMDILASHHSRSDFSSFWKSTNKLNSKPDLPVSIDGACDSSGIADVFRDHFTVNSPLGPIQSTSDEGCSGRKSSVRFLAKDVRQAIKSMSRGKSPGHDDLSIEHLKYAGCHLHRVLALFYSLCVGHSYLPAPMMKTVVVPIIKNKTGDISDKCNYRPISLATIIAKVLDSLLNTQLDKYVHTHGNQFGFKPGLSTEAAILCLKQTVKYYTDKNTPIFACFLDLSRAFDLVSYSILWQKLYQTSMPEELIHTFKYWYGNQINVVRWLGAYSTPYGLECGVRQGGLTSPKLFNLYVNALVEELSSTHVGCHIDGVCLNNISYADDMVLLSASVGGLSQLLDICEKYAKRHELTYNIKKSEWMIFQVRGKSLSQTPGLKLNGCPLKRVTQFKYLGHILTPDLKDDTDIERERRALSVRANMIAHRFARCSRDVKISLFRAYCTSFYTSSLWVKYTQKQYSALRVQYNNAFRVLLGLPRFCSASGMFAEARVDCFYTTMRKRCTSLGRRVRASSNSLLSVFAGRFDCQYVYHCNMVHVLANAKILF